MSLDGEHCTESVKRCCDLRRLPAVESGQRRRIDFRASPQAVVRDSRSDAAGLGREARIVSSDSCPGGLEAGSRIAEGDQLVTRKFYAPRRIPSPKKTTGTPQRARRTARPPYRHGCHLRLTDPPRFAQTAEGVKAGHVWAVRCKNSRDLCGGALDCEDWDAFPK